jgi:hypothetical protein
MQGVAVFASAAACALGVDDFEDDGLVFFAPGFCLSGQCGAM